MFLNRSLNPAASVNLAAGNWTNPDVVNANQVDVFKFNLTHRTSINLLASGLSGDVNIAIVQDRQAAGVAGFGVVNEGEILGSSSLVGKVAESVQLSGLAPGDYYILVAGVENANYTLNLGTVRTMEADILWRDTVRDQVGYWRFDGTQYSGMKVVNSMADEWKVEAIGDLDGDRVEDILWRHTGNGQTLAYLMDGAGTIRSWDFIRSSWDANQLWTVNDSNWRVIGIGDVDGNGKGDIVWRNEAAQAVSIWLMDGTKLMGTDAPRLNGAGSNRFCGIQIGQYDDH